MNSLVTPVVLVSNDEFWLPYALESIAGKFKQMVIYDIGSQDRTRDIIEWYVDKERNTEFLVKFLPMCPRDVQGCFRNSMIAEAGTDWYLIVDGDEVYGEGSHLKDLDLTILEGRHVESEDKEKLTKDIMPPYGVFSRIEFNNQLTHRYNQVRSHHRLYHRRATWLGGHPGEAPKIKQTSRNEFKVHNTVLHFHNTARSSGDLDLVQVPERANRKLKRTYHPGKLQTFDLLKAAPALKNKIEDFPVCPALDKLQKEYADANV